MFEVPRLDWVKDAACADISLNGESDPFYPHEGSTGARARTICAGCPVKRECLNWALDRKEQWGIWGGASETERKKINRLKGRERGAAISHHFQRLEARVDRYLARLARAS